MSAIHPSQIFKITQDPARTAPDFRRANRIANPAIAAQPATAANPQEAAAVSTKIERGYFGLGTGQPEQVVSVSSTHDFTLTIWARNLELTPSGVQVLTPPSQFRGASSTGPFDGLVMDVPAQTGVSFSSIGGRGGEVFQVSSAGGGQIVVFLTVVTQHGATVSMTAS
jgi:hypothetical protein